MTSELLESIADVGLAAGHGRITFAFGNNTLRFGSSEIGRSTISGCIHLTSGHKPGPVHLARIAYQQLKDAVHSEENRLCQFTIGSFRAESDWGPVKLTVNANQIKTYDVGMDHWDLMDSASKFSGYVKYEKYESVRDVILPQHIPYTKADDDCIVQISMPNGGMQFGPHELQTSIVAGRITSLRSIDVDDIIIDVIRSWNQKMGLRVCVPRDDTNDRLLLEGMINQHVLRYTQNKWRAQEKHMTVRHRDGYISRDRFL